MARLPIEIIDLRDNITPDLMVAVEEANQIQSEVEYSLLEHSFADDMRLFVLTHTHTGEFFNALQNKKRSGVDFTPISFASLIHRFIAINGKICSAHGGPNTESEL